MSNELDDVFRITLDANIGGIGEFLCFVVLGVWALILLYELYAFCDDEYGAWGALCRVVGWGVLVVFVALAITVVLGLLAALCTVFLSQIPIIYPIVIGSTILGIYSLRYIRRTHKAIFGHLKTDLPHSNEEQESDYYKKMTCEEESWKRREHNLGI